MISSLVASLFLAASCLFSAPVGGPVVRPFAPQGAYGGHWGIDLAAPVGTPVRPIAPGLVTFSGEIAGRSSVTVNHGGGVRSSYSYLSQRTVAVGVRVDTGSVIGLSGVDHGLDALHLSLRVGDTYIDPSGICDMLIPASGLWLVGAGPMNGDGQPVGRG
jgi:murein DD-endopeptidase MepM/ murein hydrolase activator NlpD